MRYQVTPTGEHADYTCGFCDREVAAPVVAVMEGRLEHRKFAICPRCQRAQNFDGSAHQPTMLPPQPWPGRDLDGLQGSVDRLYSELRACCSVNAHTAAVMVARTIMMHVAVDNGADPGTPFRACANHLASNGLVPPSASAWLTKIRDLGNDGTHEIEPVTADMSAMSLRFIQLLLEIVYEAPAQLRAAVPDETT